MRTESRTFRQVRRGVGGWGGVGPGGGRGGASLSRRAPSIGKNIKKTTKKREFVLLLLEWEGVGKPRRYRPRDAQDA